MRVETKARARALQLLYASELQPAATVPALATGLARLTGPEGRQRDLAEELAAEVLAEAPALDRLAAEAAEHWRLERVGVIERNILRLAIHEMRSGRVPPRVAIDEGIRLARWFAGPRAPAFVNGVLDRVARQLGLL